MSFWLVVAQVWKVINSCAVWNSYKPVKKTFCCTLTRWPFSPLTHPCLSFSPFRKKKKKSTDWHTLPTSAVYFCFSLAGLTILQRAITQNYCAGTNMVEQGGKAGRKCKVLFMLFYPDWQVPSAGAVTHPRLPRWRRLLATHQSRSPCF